MIASRIQLAHRETRMTQKNRVHNFLMQQLEVIENWTEICEYVIIVLKWFLKKQLWFYTSVFCYNSVEKKETFLKALINIFA